MNGRRQALFSLSAVACAAILWTVEPLAQQPAGQQQAPTLRVYLARHGQTDGNLVRGAIDTIRKAHAEGTILIVGHAGANAYVMRALLDMTPEEMAKNGRYVQDNDELYMIELTPGFAARVFKFIPPGKFNEL